MLVFASWIDLQVARQGNAISVLLRTLAVVRLAGMPYVLQFGCTSNASAARLHASASASASAPKGVAAILIISKSTASEG